MRVLLLSTNRLRFPYPVYPIGLDYVVGALAPRHEVRVLDLCPLAEDEVGPAIDAAVRELAPGAIGISIRNVDNVDVTSLQAFTGQVRSVVERLRSSTSAPILLGGAGFTMYPAELLEAVGADYGIVGEGERVRALVDALEAGRSPEGLTGVATRGRPAPPVVPLPRDAAPRRAPPGSNPALGWYLSHGGILNLQTQRGCAFSCVYCSYPAIEGRLRRAAEADAVALEARRLEDAGARFIFLTDSVFNGDAEASLAIADAFRRARLGVPWGAFFAPLRAPAGFYDRMAAAGCTHVEFGTESLSDRVLRRIRKAFQAEDVHAAHAAARGAGLHVAHYLLFGGPGETADTVEETLDGAERLTGSVLFQFCGMRVHVGTELERVARDEGQVPAGANLLEPVFYRPSGLPLPAIAERVQRRAASRPSWVVGGGSERAEKLIERLYARGHTGPLWEHLAGA